MGVAPTGRTVSWDVIDIVRVRDGQLVEHWNSVDALSLLTQLGALPLPG
jgi:predicted ester cyclase